MGDASGLFGAWGVVRGARAGSEKGFGSFDRMDASVVMNASIKECPLSAQIDRLIFRTLKSL